MPAFSTRSSSSLFVGFLSPLELILVSLDAMPLGTMETRIPSCNIHISTWLHFGLTFRVVSWVSDRLVGFLSARMDVIRCKGSNICSPFTSPDPHDVAIYYVSAGTGEIYAYSPPQGTHTSVVFSGGEPYGAKFDASGRLHIADCAHTALLRVDDSGQPGVMVKNYEEKSFRGPSSLAFGENETIYFTDSGPMGETTLERPRGSVFCISPSPSGGQMLRPLVWECLAHPSAIATSPTDTKVLYVAEQMANRVLRLIQRPANTYHTSVFHQFAGGLGPSCVTVDRHGSLYVGHFDYSGPRRSQGKISVLSSDGVVSRTLDVPGIEITGICLSADETTLYVTEASTNALYRIPL